MGMMGRCVVGLFVLAWVFAKGFLLFGSVYCCVIMITTDSTALRVVAACGVLMLAGIFAIWGSNGDTD